jgi:hypothetical protein
MLCRGTALQCWQSSPCDYYTQWMTSYGPRVRPRGKPHKLPQTAPSLRHIFTYELDTWYYHCYVLLIRWRILRYMGTGKWHDVRERNQPLSIECKWDVSVLKYARWKWDFEQPRDLAALWCFQVFSSRMTTHSAQQGFEPTTWYRYAQGWIGRLPALYTPSPKIPPFDASAPDLQNLMHSETYFLREMVTSKILEYIVLASRYFQVLLGELHPSRMQGCTILPARAWHDLAWRGVRCSRACRYLACGGGLRRAGHTYLQADLFSGGGERGEFLCRFHVLVGFAEKYLISSW